MSSPWERRFFGDFLRESRVAGSNGTSAQKMTVRLYGRGVVRKDDIRGGSENTKYFRRKAGQFIYSKLDFLNGALALIPQELDGRETTLDLPAFDIDSSVEPGWLINFVTRRDFYESFAAAAKGSRKARRVNPEEFLTRDVLVPPLGEQRKIAAILAEVNGAIEGTKAVIDQLQVVKKAMMLELLTRGLPRRDKRYKVTEIGELPDDWNVLSVSEACSEAFLGLTSKVDYVTEGGVPLIRASDFSGGIVRKAGARRISEAQHRFLTRYRSVRRGDVLISKSGTLGTCAIVETDEPLSVYESVIVIRGRAGIANGNYLLWCFRAENTQERLLGGRVGSTVGHLNLEPFRTFKVPVPGIAEQGDIARIMSGFEERIQAEQSHYVTLKLVQTKLKSALLTGDLRVTPGEATP